MKTDKDTLKRVHETRASVAKTFQDKWTQATENARFVRLLQYSDEQLQKMTAQNRIPYVLDFVTLAINTQLGDQRENRSDILYLPAQADDDIRAEVLNAVKDTVLRQNDFIFLESDVFQDGVIEKTGCLGYDWDVSVNPLGELKLFRIPPRQMTWDLNRRDFSLKTAQWISRYRLYGKRELSNKYPDFKKEIERLDLQSYEDMAGLGLDITYLKQILDTDLGAAATIEFYERNYQMRYFVLTDDNISNIYWDSEKEAKNAIREKVQYYDQVIVPQFNLAGEKAPELKLEIKGVPSPIIQKTELAANVIFQNTEQTDLPDFPYDIYHPYFHDGEWWSVADLYKDPQRFVNKMFSLIDHQISTSSKGLLLVDDKIPDNQFQAIKNAWSKTGGAERVSDIAGVNHIKPDSFDPRLIGAMDIAISNLEKKAGGGNFLGQQESAGESGIAIRQRVERGSASSFIIFDNLRRFKKSVGEKIAWYLTNKMTASQKVRLEGEELTQMAKQELPQWFKESSRPGVGFLSINTHESNSISDLKVDVIVDEIRHSVTKNQQTLMQLADMLRSSPMLAETIPPGLMIELFDLPASIKRQMKQQSDELLKAKMARDEAANQKPPSLSASLSDITLFENDPMAQSQFAARFGIQLNSSVKESDGSQETLLKSALTSHDKDKEMALKDKHHEEQMGVKMLEIISNHLNEQEKNKNGAKNAKAV